MTDTDKYCSALGVWADLLEVREKELGVEPMPGSPSFAKARRVVELAIFKSCLLDRMMYGGEQPSQTPCPVHAGFWSGHTRSVARVSVGSP